ncbi:MAG: sugar phosphorylase [Chloroflexi bacterium]|nr:sugar phosphorylase [Chloroflexota bacterium]
MTTFAPLDAFPLAPPAQRWRQELERLYGAQGPEVAAQLEQALRAWRERLPEPAPGRRVLTQRDALLITYGDQFRDAPRPPLAVLADALDRWVRPGFSWVHLLPFFPYSSDDGFAVIDYGQVNPAWGTWDHIHRLQALGFDLMFDLVLNHVSSQHPWFQAFLRGEPEHQDTFLHLPPDTDLSDVVRPRPWPLLTRFETAQGPRWVWTTFSADQIDLNYRAPHVLLAMVNVMLDYVAHGASMLRLDAVAFTWKEVGTSCIHLPQAHALVRLFRAVLDDVAPHVLLLTETNVPHEENVRYFGDGYNEAQLVYQFPLPPLVLHTLLTRDSRALTEWARSVAPPTPATTFLNFLASHDGIGVRPVEGLLRADEVERLVEHTLAQGGEVSYRALPDGSRAVYELNITYWDALNPAYEGEPLERQVARFLAAHAILFALQGMPAVYVHSLFGSRGDREAVERTGQPRAINRARFALRALARELAQPRGRRRQVYDGMMALLQARARTDAFHPQQPQHVLAVNPGVFALWRGEPGAPGSVLALHEIAGTARTVRVPWPARPGPLVDVRTGRALGMAEGPTLTIPLRPYEVLWLRVPARAFTSPPRE